MDKKGCTLTVLESKRDLDKPCMWRLADNL